MLLLVCLFFITCSYASEDNTPLLEVIIENDSSLLENTLVKYKTEGLEYWQNTQETPQVHFYDLINKTVRSFDPNTSLINLFSILHNVKLSTITELPEIQSLFQQYQLYPDLKSKFDLLFKSIDEFDFAKNQSFRKEFLYHFKLFLYILELNPDSSTRTGSYENFLKSVKECTLNFHDTTSQSFKKEMLYLNGLFTITFGSCFTGLSIAGVPNASYALLATIICPSLMTGVAVGTTTLHKHFVYKKFLKTIKSLKDKAQE